MKGKSLELLAALTLFGAMPNVNISSIRAEDISGRLPDPPVPKGCKIYFFNSNGSYSTNKNKVSNTVFKCTATNDKNAIRKFNNWENNQQ